jgi:transglutaminase-like putative cysteine protease
MQRSVSAQMIITIHSPILLILSAAVAASIELEAEEFAFTHEGQTIAGTELRDVNGTRLHTFTVEAGTMTLDYRAVTTGLAGPAPISELDLLTYRRQSRYCQSDELLPIARSEFQGLLGVELIQAVEAWVNEKLRYVPGFGRHTDGALETLITRRGVCRDYAHLVIGLLRALDLPARMVSVYAPGLAPMDFHAVVEAYADGVWYVIDATRLAPRQSFVRIATGRDAADIAFLSNYNGRLRLGRLEVMATSDEFVTDDHSELVTLR